MPATTPRGAPYPVAADNNGVPADLQALAEWVDLRPGISTLTTTQRDALAGVELWTGRVIFNTTTARLERWNGAAWIQVVDPAWRGARVAPSAGQSIPHATTTIVNFDLETDDTLSMHDNVTANSRLTVPAGFDGRWLVQAAAAFATNGTGSRQARIYKNGAASTVTAAGPTSASLPWATLVSDVIAAVAGDYFELGLYQDSGGALDTFHSRMIFSATYLGS